MFKTSFKKIIASLLLIVTIFNCTLITFTPEVNAASDRFFQTAKGVHAQFRRDKFQYNLSVLKQITKSPYKTNNRKITDCSHFVSVALYKYFSSEKRLYMRQNTEVKNAQLSSVDFMNIGNRLNGKSVIPRYFSVATINKLANYFTLVTTHEKLTTKKPKNKKGLKRGDILVYSGHVEIFVYKKYGKLYVLNCGGNDSIRVKGDVSESNHKIDQIQYVLRVK